MSRMLCFVVCLGAMIPTGVLAAEADTVRAFPRARLVILSVPESARVVVDARFSGTTPFTLDSIASGSHTLTVQYPPFESWLTEPVHDTISIGEGEEKVLRYGRRTQSFITSTPFGADVMAGDSVLGTTPFLTGPGMEGVALTLRKAGYAPATVEVHPGATPRIDVTLTRLWQKEDTGEWYARDTEGRGDGSAKLYLSGASAVVSGVAAAYFKIKADDKYQQFLDTNDGRFLRQTHRLDTAAGVALAATQASLALFTYFLISR